jgi:hypothetical protein
MPKISQLTGAVFFVLATHTVHSEAGAAEKTADCKAVQNIASITLSDKLVFSMASDSASRFCHFYVSLPPPASTRKSVDYWYGYPKASQFDAKGLVKIVADIATAAIPEKETTTRKEVESRIDVNTDLVVGCITLLYKQGPFDQKSKDGSLRCVVRSPFASLSLTVAVGDAFLSTVSLPRPL